MAPVGFLPLWPQTSKLQHEGVVVTVKTLLTVSELSLLAVLGLTERGRSPGEGGPPEFHTPLSPQCGGDMGREG